MFFLTETKGLKSTYLQLPVLHTLLVLVHVGDNGCYFHFQHKVMDYRTASPHSAVVPEEQVSPDLSAGSHCAVDDIQQPSSDAGSHSEKNEKVRNVTKGYFVPLNVTLKI